MKIVITIDMDASDVDAMEEEGVLETIELILDECPGHIEYTWEEEE